MVCFVLLAAGGQSSLVGLHYNLLIKRYLMSQQQQTMKWGDIVRIHGVSTVRDKEAKGLIISKGFTDPNVYYQTYQNYDEVNFYRESLFQILPKSNFDLHDQLQIDENLKDQQKDALRERAKEEITNLENALLSKYSDPEHPDIIYVTYGSEVVFRHIESGEYLSGVLKAADIGEGAFKLQLVKELSSFLYFRIISHRSYEQIGNKIYYDDCLRIHHTKSDCYMNFPDTEISIIFDRPYEAATFQPGEAGYEYAQTRPSIKKPINRRINVINQNKSKCLWKFILHCRFEDSKKKEKIKSHDIVYFQHTRNKGLIASTLAQQKYYLKELKDTSEQSVSYQCFWELIPKEGNEFGPETCNLFWARNIVTGQILQFDNFNVEIQSKEQIENGGFKSEGLVNLICALGDEDEKGNRKRYLLERGDNIPNDDNVDDVVKYFDENIRKIDFRKVEQLAQDSFIIVRVSEETILDVSYVLSSQEAFVKVVETISTELKNKKSNPDVTWKDMFLKLNEDLLVSFISVLKLLIGKIYGTDYREIESSGNSPIRQIQKILVQTGIAQLIIELIFTLYEPFQEILSNNDITEDRAIRLKIAQIFELSYVLVEKIVKDFLQNKIYFSRWIRLFLMQSNHINKPFIQECLVNILQNNPVSIRAMITDRIIEDLINYFFAEAAENGEGDLTTKHLRLFSTFIRGDDVIFKENQKKILVDFFMSERNNYNFKFKVEYRISEADENSDNFFDKDRNKVVKVSFGGDDPCTLPEFFQRFPNKFNYLLSYINLLADVCMDRNNEAYEYVQANVPLAVVSTILFDNDIKLLNEKLKQANGPEGEVKRFPNTNIHEPFIRIAHHAYVNNFNFSPIRRIRKIVKWYRFEEEKEVAQVEDITKTKRVYEGEKEEEERTYLSYLLAYIKKFLETYDKDTSNKINDLQILYTVLNFLKETIILGLWESIDQFRQIIPLLIKNITKIQGNIFFEKYDQSAQNRYNGREWVDLNKEKLRMNRPEIALQIECKIKATEIFKYMNEMEIDIRLRYMMNFFQGIYEATENFENYSQSIEDELQISEEQPQEERENIVARNEHARTEFYKIFGTNILGEIKKVSEDQDLMLKEYIWYNKIRTMIPLVYQKTQQPDKDRDLFKHSDDYPLRNIVLSLFELSGYYNQSLLNNSLKMLRAMFQQRSDLISSFKDLLICGKGNLNEVYSNLKFMRNKFAMLKNDTIIRYDGIENKSFAYAIFKPYDHLGREQDKRSGIIQDLFFLARTLKDNVSLKNIESLMFVEKEVFDKSIVYHFYNEKEKNNSLFQQLNMAEGIYDPLLEYIKIIGKEDLPEIHRWLLFSIYQYLTLLCFNNMKAKHIFMEYIPYIIPHLNKRVGAASFLYEVCINNKILVNNEQLVSLIIEGALNSCIELEQEQLIHGIVSKHVNQDLNLNNNFEKSRILYALRGVLIFNDEGHKRNQQMLMNRLQDNKFRILVFNDVLSYTAKKEDFNLSPAETYATTHFELFSSLVQSENLINIGKLQNLHKYEICLQTLSQTNRWQIRRALRSYVNRLYYVHKDYDQFLFEEFIRYEFGIINKELSDLIQLHRSKMLTQDLKVKNGIRFVFAQSEIILLIIEILISLHEIFLKPLFIKLLKRQLAKEQKLQDQIKKLHPSLIKLLKHLGCIEKLYHNTKTIVSFVREIKKLMENILLTFHVRYLEKMSEPQADQSQKEEVKQKEPQLSKKTYSFDHSRTFFRNLVEMIKFLKHQETHEKLKEEYIKRKNQMDVSENDLKKKYIDAIFAVPGENLRPINSVKIKETEELHYKPHLQTANSKIFKVLAKPELQQNEQNLQLNTRLNNVKELLTDSPAFKKLKQDQFYKLVHLFRSMDDGSAQIYAQNWKSVSQEPRPVFSKKEIITNCFSLIINHPDQITDSQKIFIIKLVRCYISEAVEEKQNHKLSVDKWNADYYTDDHSGDDPSNQERSELVKRQHEIEECGGSKLLLFILKENLFGKTELLNETLLLGIVYLFNGNTHCQNSILTELLNDPSNITFMALKQLIKNIGNFLIEVRKFKQNEKKRVFSYKIVDSYDHFDSKENILVKMFGHKTDKFEIETELNYELALCRIFRFLQLFCENNNIQMKKFLMTQTNPEGTEKITSINFILEACQLLRQFFKIMSSKVVNIPPSLLDFINEITQIPCLDCQKSLMRSTFFEDISYMAGFFESKENIEQRKFSFFIETNPKKDDDEPAPAEEEDPLSTLQEIYEKGIGLALSNFQGNDSEIFWEFLNKCQAKYLWVVIRQNMIKLLRPKAAKFGVNRDDIEKQVEKEYLEAIEQKEEKRVIFQQYREFLVEYAFIRRIFKNFNQREISKFITQQKSLGQTYCQEIINIINVLAILKKIDDYAEKREKAAIANPQVINLDESNKALKARNFRKDLWKYAKDDQYPHIVQFTSLFEELILSIEISSDNGETVGFQNLYFPNHPVFSYLAADTRDSIMFQVSRETRRDKLTTLFDFYGELKEEIESNYKLKYYSMNVFGFFSFPISITSGLIDEIRKMARYISYLICALMLIFIIVQHDTVEQASYFNFFHSHEQMVMRILRIIQLLLTIIFCFLWIKMRYNLCMSKWNSEQQQKSSEEEEQADQQQDDSQAPVPTSLIQKIFYYAVKIQKIFLKTLGKVSSTLNSTKEVTLNIVSKPGLSHIGSFLKFLFNPVINFIKTIFVGFLAMNKYQSGFLSILIFVLAAIMGNFVGVQWYVIHLFDYFVGISLLTNVFKAVIDNIGELSILSAFAGCFILVFNIVSLNTYTPVIYEDQIPAEACEDVIDCVLTVYTSGAIGDDMDDLYGGRFFFDTIYFIFMEILFSNLVSGIMIDGFGGLKQADAERDDDKKNKCYICSMEKPDIQKTGTTFKKHTEKHFLWNYLFYRYVVQMKDPSDYTGLQYTISTQINEKKVEWFPDNGPKEESGEIETLMSTIKENTTKMTEQIHVLIDKTSDDIKNSTKAISTGIEKVTGLKSVKEQPEEALAVEAQQ